jgi:hypothetical protein
MQHLCNLLSIYKGPLWPTYESCTWIRLRISWTLSILRTRSCVQEIQPLIHYIMLNLIVQVYGHASCILCLWIQTTCDYSLATVHIRHLCWKKRGICRENFVLPWILKQVNDSIVDDWRKVLYEGWGEVVCGAECGVNGTVTPRHFYADSARNIRNIDFSLPCCRQK